MEGFHSCSHLEWRCNSEILETGSKKYILERWDAPSGRQNNKFSTFLNALEQRNNPVNFRYFACIYMDSSPVCVSEEVVQENVVNKKFCTSKLYTSCVS